MIVFDGSRVEHGSVANIDIEGDIAVARDLMAFSYLFDP